MGSRRFTEEMGGTRVDRRESVVDFSSGACGGDFRDGHAPFGYPGFQVGQRFGRISRVFPFVPFSPSESKFAVTPEPDSPFVPLGNANPNPAEIENHAVNKREDDVRSQEEASFVFGVGSGNSSVSAQRGENDEASNDPEAGSSCVRRFDMENSGVGNERDAASLSASFAVGNSVKGMEVNGLGGEGNSTPSVAKAFRSGTFGDGSKSWTPPVDLSKGLERMNLNNVSRGAEEGGSMNGRDANTSGNSRQAGDYDCIVGGENSNEARGVRGFADCSFVAGCVDPGLEAKRKVGRLRKKGVVGRSAGAPDVLMGESGGKDAKTDQGNKRSDAMSEVADRVRKLNLGLDTLLNDALRRKGASDPDATLNGTEYSEADEVNNRASGSGGLRSCPHPTFKGDVEEEHESHAGQTGSVSTGSNKPGPFGSRIRLHVRRQSSDQPHRRASMPSYVHQTSFGLQIDVEVTRNCAVNGIPVGKGRQQAGGEGLESELDTLHLSESFSQGTWETPLAKKNRRARHRHRHIPGSGSQHDSPLTGGDCDPVPESPLETAQTDAVNKATGSEASPENSKALREGEAKKCSGNGLFKAGEYAAAVVEYGCGIDAVWGASGGQGVLSCLYGNRAAARIMTGDICFALEDCERAIAVNPQYMKAHIRRANCLLRLGEFSRSRGSCKEAAGLVAATYPNCSELDEISKEVEKWEAHYDDSRNTVVTAVDKSVFDRAMFGIRVLCENVNASEKTRALLVYALLKSGRWSEAAKEVHKASEELNTGQAGTFTAVWWLWIFIQAKWQIKGDINEACSQSEKLLKLLEDNSIDSFNCLVDSACVVTVGEVKVVVDGLKEAILFKNNGNEEIKAKDCAAAVEKYSKALTACGTCGAPAHFVAVLHSNRAAAYQGLKKYAEAIGDCCRAVALDPDFIRAHSRLAQLLMEVKHPEAALNTLEKMKSCRSATHADVRSAQLRMADSRKLLVKSPTPNHYSLLGLKREATQADIRRAYKLLALRFHPDKALANCKFGTCFGRSGIQGVGQSDLSEKVREEASWLFKCINEANAALMDEDDRAALDRELDMEEGKYSGGFGQAGGSWNGGQFGRDGFRRHGRSANGYDFGARSHQRYGNWNSYGHGYGRYY